MELLPAFAIMLRRVGVSGMRAVVQRSITFGGRKTSVTLEDAFWEALKEIAYSRRMTISDLVREIDAQRRHNNLSSAIRLFVLEFYRSQIPNPAKAWRAFSGVGAAEINRQRPALGRPP